MPFSGGFACLLWIIVLLQNQYNAISVWDWPQGHKLMAGDFCYRTKNYSFQKLSSNSFKSKAASHYYMSTSMFDRFYIYFYISWHCFSLMSDLIDTQMFKKKLSLCHMDTQNIFFKSLEDLWSFLYRSNLPPWNSSLSIYSALDVFLGYFLTNLMSCWHSLGVMLASLPLLGSILVFLCWL